MQVLLISVNGRSVLDTLRKSPPELDAPLERPRSGSRITPNDCLIIRTRRIRASIQRWGNALGGAK